MDPDRDLSNFPVHAAGRHADATAADPCSVASRVVSSYATSLTTLSGPHADQSDPAAGRFVVAMPQTPSLGPDGDLPDALVEATEVGRQLAGDRSLVGPAVTGASVIAAAAEAEVLHLACHAESRPGDRPRAGSWCRTG